MRCLVDTCGGLVTREGCCDLCGLGYRGAEPVAEAVGVVALVRSVMDLVRAGSSAEPGVHGARLEADARRGAG